MKNFKFRVGDTVQVTDWGEMFSRCTDFFDKHHNEIVYNYMVRYAYGDNSNFIERNNADSSEYVVLYVYDGKALISKSLASGAVYLINTKGLKPVNVVEMTLAEIERQLGCRICIVEDSTDGS